MTVMMAARKRPRPSGGLVELRCPSCGKLLANIRLTAGAAVEVRCPRCRIVVMREAA